MLIFILSHCLPVAHPISFCHISIGGGDSILPSSAAEWEGAWLWNQIPHPGSQVSDEYFGISSVVTLYNKAKAQKNQKNKQSEI